MADQRPPRSPPPSGALFSSAGRPKRERERRPQLGPSHSSSSSTGAKLSDAGSSYYNSNPSYPYTDDSGAATPSHSAAAAGLAHLPTLSYPQQSQSPQGRAVQFSPPPHPSSSSSADYTSRQNLLSQKDLPALNTQLGGPAPLLGPGGLPAGAAPPGHGQAAGGAKFVRAKSLVRPERERVDENHRLRRYREHAAEMEAEGRGVAGVSRTGHVATDGLYDSTNVGAGGGLPGATGLRRGKSILAREEGMANETGLSMFKRGATLRRHRKDGQPLPNTNGGQSHVGQQAFEKRKAADALKAQKQPLGPWMIFCLAVTICCPSPLLKCFGLRTKDRQSAWREKVGLLVIIGMSMAAVGFLTFGFTEAVCGTPALRYRTGNIGTGSMIYHGYNYDLDKFQHPSAAGIEGGTNPLYDLFAAAAMDGSFLFQTVNERCLNIITPAKGTGIVNSGNKLGWYFPCNLYNQWGSTPVNLTGYAEGVMCHTQTDARSQFAALKPLGQVYYTWQDLRNSTRNLGVYDGAVLDFSLLKWLDTTQVTYPPLFDTLKNGNASFTGRDITALMVSSGNRDIAGCMVDSIRVGFIDSVTIGCVASDVVLYVSLAVIIGVVVLRFAMAVVFGWFLSWKIGKFPNETYAQRMARSREIENWTEDIYRPAPGKYRPNVLSKAYNGGYGGGGGQKKFLPTTSRFSKGDLLKGGVVSANNLGGGNRNVDAKYGEYRKSVAGSTFGGKSGMLGAGMRNSPPSSPGGVRASRSSTSLPASSYQFDGSRSPSGDGIMGACPFPLIDVVPQPPSDFEPFNYPLVHTLLLVTAYSESVEGLRTTLDSLATTDYPNSHKVILVIADGMVKGSGNKLTTPEIALSMMKELVVPAEDVEAQSYVAIADGHKRHNKAKVFAGFYEYDNNTVEMSKQQRVPMMLVAKVGNDAEINDPKPGNRGKRDSQIVLMAFLQKVMFDERMSSFEYEFFNSLWRCSGVSPDRFETVLCVDADTKVFPDSISRMNACMVHDPEIMGLCGETKIANKAETWVTMIQVFEYYVSHHLTKAFESVFGGVTCLPGCFSMYRIKAPKGGEGYWVPILANPDIVERYSENVVNTLHKKNLLLLGEDRYLTTLMLSTFPRRKMMFCPQAVCKTVVPDTFRVLLSQRRRWINSTVHNLFELFIVPDLCGVFCFSMRFVVFMELAGTLVLPAAIAFTLYLIIVAIIPGTTKPVVSLILLAIILGIPAVLIVVTSRKVAYLGWMMVYLISLPIWNFLLPFYAFLHMDDFSWGETRKVVGDTGRGHGDKDGEFDSSHIVMKRWVDFERDRRIRLGGGHSRDTTYDAVMRTGSPSRSISNRYSVVSTDTHISGGGSGSTNDAALYRRSSPGVSASQSQTEFYGPRHQPTQLELPAPLAAQGQSPASTSIASSQYDVASEMAPTHEYRNSMSAEVLSNPFNPSDYPRYTTEGYDSDELESQAILRDSPGMGNSPIIGSGAFTGSSYSPRPEREQRMVFTSEPEPAYRQSSEISRATSQSPPRSESVSSRQSNNPFANAPQGQKKPRGVSLVDDGPVPGSEGFRTVQRTRRTSQGPVSPVQRSRNSLASYDPSTMPASSNSGSRSPSLPPGAAPPTYGPQ